MILIIKKIKKWNETVIMNEIKVKYILMNL